MTKRNHSLYSFRRCPYAMRAQMALVNAKIPFDIIEVDLKNKPVSLMNISPKGTVPVLQTIDGCVIDESLAIVEWACGDDFDHELVGENDGDFKAALDRYKYPARFPDEDCSDARDKGEAFLQRLEHHVDPTVQTLTDICIFPFVRQFAHVDKGWFDGLPYSNVQAWLTMNVESELFRMTFDKGFTGFVPHP